MRQHREKYCRYREGKLAKPRAVTRQRGVVEIDDDWEFWSDADECRIWRTNVSINGRVRDYRMAPEGDVVDVERWLFGEEALVRKVFDLMHEYLVKGR